MDTENAKQRGHVNLGSMGSRIEHADRPPVLVWKVDSHVGREDIDQAPTVVNARPAPSEISSNLSEVVDNGEEAQLNISSLKPKKAVTGETVTIDCLSGINPRTAEVPDGYDSIKSLNFSSSDTASCTSSLNDRPWDEQILLASHPEGYADFLPYDDLEKLMVEAHVRDYLTTHELLCTTYSPAQLEAMTNRILNREKVPDPRDSHDQPEDKRRPMRETCRRKILAILASEGMADKIPFFIDHGIYDCHLPFTINFAKGTVCREIGGALEPMPFKWKQKELEDLNNFQLKMTAPFFDMEDFKCPHLKLKSSTVLPFSAGPKTTQVQGGFGDVEKIQIHPAHHNYHPANDDQPLFFARKCLAKGSLSPEQYKSRFRNERGNLLRVRKDPNVITLLASYELDGQYYFLFPWAHGGDLKAFWGNHSTETRLKDKDETLPLWLITQFLAIATGLDAVHQPTDSRDVDQFLQLPGKAKVIYGRHGDLKPGNILCFKGEGDALGYFQISDFGLSACHGSRSIQENASKMTGLTFCYRSPEIAVHRSVNRSYDVWPLGCVLLEFVGWYLHGWPHVDDFSGRRCIESNRNQGRAPAGADDPFHKDFFAHLLSTDDFFNEEVKSVDGQDMRTAKIKPSVGMEIALLREDENCSDLLLDVLNFIEDKLLRMHWDKRAPSSEIVETFQEMVQMCRDDPSYGTHKTKAPRRMQTDLSEIDNRSVLNLPADPSPLDQGFHSAQVVVTIQAQQQQDPGLLVDIPAPDSVQDDPWSPEVVAIGRRPPFQPPRLIVASTSATMNSEVWDGQQDSDPGSPHTTPTRSQPHSSADSITFQDSDVDGTIITASPKPQDAMGRPSLSTPASCMGYGTMEPMGATKGAISEWPSTEEEVSRSFWSRLSCC